ncbi:hypothetical protein HDV01_005052 [Terramyces sp. JEL0728]|nr:hypothetical protein HDV01_005052 [Terramyces sp. JEL0728]
MQARTLYKNILREIQRFPNPQYYKLHLKEQFKIRSDLQEAKNIYDLLLANRTHTEMMERYWPASQLSDSEKLQRTANKVGFNLPKTFAESKDAN